MNRCYRRRVQAGPSVPELRPLSVGEVLDVAIKIYFRNAATLFAIVLLIVAPVQTFSSLVQVSASIDEDPFTTTSTTGEIEVDTDEIWLYATGFGVLIVLALVSSTLATGACFKAVSDAYLGERPTWLGSLRFALRRVHSIFWVTVLGGFLAFLGLIACIIPGIWLYVSFAVAVPVLLTEGVRGRRALGRSRRLVKGRWWPAFGILVLGTILAAVVSGVITGVLGALSLADPDNEFVAFVLGAVGGTVASTLTTPFQAAFVTVLYVDLRVRKEGFDLQLLAERIGLAAPREGGFRPAPVALPPRPPAPAAGAASPPYWPPPPGWTPSPDDAPAPREPGADPDHPPWPRPPGCKPRSER
jgi:hypothetical protein